MSKTFLRKRIKRFKCFALSLKNDITKKYGILMNLNSERNVLQTSKDTLRLQFMRIPLKIPWGKPKNPRESQISCMSGAREQMKVQKG